MSLVVEEESNTALVICVNFTDFKTPEGSKKKNRNLLISPEF